MTVNTLPTSSEVTNGTQTNANQKVDFASMLDFLLQVLGAKSGQGPQTVASAATLNLNAVTDTRDIVISGTTTITAVTVEAGKVFRCRASGAFTLTNNTDIVTQTAADIVCAAGDSFTLRATAANTVEVLEFTRAVPAVLTTGAQTIAGVKTFSSQPVLPQALTQGTAVSSTSGTSIDFTSIPSWVKGIDIIFAGVSTSGSSNLLCQVGDAGGVETSGYTGGAVLPQSGTTTAGANSTAGFILTGGTAGSLAYDGIIRLRNVSGHLWVMDGILARSDTGAGNISGGSKTLSPGPLDRVRITTVGGTDTFDAGSINIIYQ